MYVRKKNACGTLDRVKCLLTYILPKYIPILFVGILSEGEMQPGSRVPRDWGK